MNAKSMKAVQWVIALPLFGYGIWVYTHHLATDPHSKYAMAIGAVERLQIVWPNIAHFTPDDRRLLADLASDCNLPKVPPVRERIVACLQSTVVDTQHSHPGLGDVQSRLANLLAAAPPTTPQAAH